MSDTISVDARPTKSFFVDMLTRDISVVDSLLDLCDNALGRTFSLANADPASVVTDNKRSTKPLKAYHLKITVKSSSVRIEDNCGGISQDQARNEIFRLGRDSTTPVEKGLSVYGIGMKRAFFKLGDQISLRSSQEREWFEVAFSVSTWKKQGDDDWSLKFKRSGTSGRPSEIPANGTVVEIKKLRAGVRELVSTATFLPALRKRLQTTYSLFVESGLKLVLNGEPIVATLPILAKEPLGRKTLTVDKVAVTILAGLTPPKTQANTSTSGWFVYCNGRLVLDADKTKTTGWGENLQQWHSKFGRFVGYVFFNSNDSRKLPWTTTKQGLVDDAEVFLRTKQEMQLQARPVLDFLSRMYPAEIPDDGVQEREILAKAKPAALSELPKTDRVFKAVSAPRPPKAETNIQYKKPTDRVDMVRAKLGRSLSPAQIGSKTFDYYYDNECGE